MFDRLEIGLGTARFPNIAPFWLARPFTMATPFDVNGDGTNSNDRAVVNGVQTTLDEFRGTPFQQINLRVSRPIHFGDRATLTPFVECFNLLNRANAGNNFVSDISALVPPGEFGNATHVCATADCSVAQPITSLNSLRVPAGALGDFFGPGTTVGMPFAAQIGVRFSF